MTRKHLQGVLRQPDIELIQRSAYGCADDIAVSIARGFERLTERIDTMEKRMQSELHVRLREIMAAKQELAST